MPFGDDAREVMDLKYFVTTMDTEARALEVEVRTHATLHPFFTLDFAGRGGAELRNAYLRLLKIKADYVSHTVPMLRAAGLALRQGNEEDRRWSERFLAYAEDETDEKERYGHQAWARNDMVALGATREFMDAPPHASVLNYRRFFVEEAGLHPYAILGAKGVLEHLSIRISDDLVRGVVASRIENGAEAVSFFAHHGVLDLEHVRAGDASLETIHDDDRRAQVLAGAYFTSGSYRAFLHFAI